VPQRLLRAEDVKPFLVSRFSFSRLETGYNRTASWMKKNARAH
jgi:hypothetical protein